MSIFQINLKNPEQYYTDENSLYLHPSFTDDLRINCAAFGALCFLLTYPQSELWTAGKLAHFSSKEGAEACERILKALLEVNYIKRAQVVKTFGWVYLIEAQVNGVSRHKIGESLDPYIRFDAIQSHSPVELTLKHLIISNDRQQLEKELHAKYKAQRIQLGKRRGEWFELKQEQVAEILKMGGDRNV